MITSKHLLDSIGRTTTGGVDPFPLGVLATLFFFDEFDTAAFNVLGPQIKESFGLSQSEFATLVVANLSVVLLLAIPLGHFADRLPRRKLIVAGAALAGICSLLTGLVPGALVALLVLVRLGNGVGRLINDPIHTSYLADTYKPADRPKVFSFHRNAPYLGAIFGSALAGVVASLTGSFRVAFAILIVPILGTAFVALRLPEPRRGATDRLGGDEAEPDPFGLDEAPAPFREATTILFGVKTLKRQFASWLFIGAGLVPLAALLPVYLEDTFGLGPLARGAVTALNAACTFAAIRAAGPWTQRWMAGGLGVPVRRAGASLAGVGVGIFLTAIVPGTGTPSLIAVIVLGAATSFVAGIFTPPFVTTQALVSPARVRTLSFSFGSLFLVTGVWVLYILPGIAKLADESVRQGLGATAPFWVIGGLVLASAGRFVEADTMAAINGAALAAEARAGASAAGDTLLLCRGVEVGYDQVQILFGVDLEVHKGEIVALLGTNGAGKSTLLRAITGLTDPMGGAIWFEGNDVTHADPQTALAAGIVLVPGGRAVFPTLTVAEHLRTAGWLYRDDPAYLAQANEEVLATFPRLRERLQQMAGDLSGGEQQMLALGMAFIAKPKLLLIDELSLGLAPTIVEQLLLIVRRIRDSGTAIVLVEQSINVALTVAERAYFLEKGEVRFEGPTSELLHRDDILRSVFLQGAGDNLGAAAEADTDDASGFGGLGSFGADVDRNVATHDGPALEVRNLVMRFGGITAVDDTSFSVQPGEILGLIGANGAGKTTIFDLVSGFLTPTGGRVLLAGHDVTKRTPDARARLRLGRSFQDARLIPSLTVAENLALSLERHLEVRGMVASALGLPEVLRQEEDIAYSVGDLVDLCGLGAFRDKAARDLSTGSRRIVDLAMCIAHDPAVLLLDEPAAGIAQREAEALGPLLRRIRDETGCALLLIEHDMPLICGVADRLICLELGAPIAEGTPAEVMADARVQASYLGGDLATINRSGTTLTAPAPAPAPAAPRTAAARRAERAERLRRPAGRGPDA